MEYPVIDFHVHLVDYDWYRPWVVEWIQEFMEEDFEGVREKYSDPKAFVTLMDEYGVDYSVVMAEQSPITTGIAGNEKVGRFCAASPRLIPFCTINPHLEADPARSLERLVDEFGFRGIKLYPTYNHFYPNAPELYPLYGRAQDLGLVVMVHTGSSIFKGSRIKYGDPVYLDDVAVDFPELKILLVHSGRGFWYDRAFFLARLHPNVYMEISGLPPKKLLTYFPEFERNAEKIIFGSDWPGLFDVKGNLEAIRKLEISDRAKGLILGGNAARVLGLG